MSDSKNNIAWEQLFQKHKILDDIKRQGKAIITSTNINKYREARLMTKFDHKSQLPKIFVDNSLSILPISRGSYIIAGIETFCDFENTMEIETQKIDFPNFLESLNYKEITSEATAINCAFISEILKNFTGEEELYPTVSGRMGSSSFDFRINSGEYPLKIDVKNAQIEIDGGYEGINTLTLIEAKNYISNDFLVRQLYYPFRLWAGKIEKKVRPVFLTYTNGVFHLREYTFENPKYYNSLKLIHQKKYLISEGAINVETIQTILNTVRIVQEPQIAFPQADSFERVINLCELLKQKTFLTKEEVTTNYDFDERQTNYYTDAARYLGFVEKQTIEGQITFSLSKKGNKLFDLSISERQLEFVKAILAHKVFNKTLHHYLETGESPSKHEVVNIMKTVTLYNVDAESTYYRRSSTVISWVAWVLNLVEE